jgi:hypothetical protein
MTQQNINAGDTGAVARAKINANATELYTATDALNSSVANLETTTSALNSSVADLDANAQKIGDPVNLVATNPAAPSTGSVTLFRKSVGGRQLPAFIGPSGLDSALQPLLARNKVGFWCPPGNATTVPGILGFTAFSVTGTATARNVATTRMFTRMRRLGYVSATAAGSLAGARVAVAQITLGTTASGIPVGGFFKVIRFGCSDAATVDGARQFVGISASTGAPTNVEPSTLVNSIGVGHGAADTNLFLYWGGSAAQTPIDLGVNFPANTLSVDVYELALFCASGSAEVNWQVTRLNTGHVASGTLTGTLGTQLPAVTTLLTYSQNWRSNNATALAVGLDIFSDYIETDQ